MNYIIVVYSIFLIILSCFGYRNNLGVSIMSILISLFLFVSALFNVFYTNNYLKLLTAVLLILLSVGLFYDRKRSGKKINYHHHLIRLTFHALLIYYLLLG
ncbi:hypothetical protein FRX52_00710 [Streptococcus sp. sy018]|nr:hypothetical protein FRX52_00710 [Streptococcus sp. sy018]